MDDNDDDEEDDAPPAKDNKPREASTVVIAVVVVASEITTVADAVGRGTRDEDMVVAQRSVEIINNASALNERKTPVRWHQRD